MRTIEETIQDFVQGNTVSLRTCPECGYDQKESVRLSGNCRCCGMDWSRHRLEQLDKIAEQMEDLIADY